MAYDIHGNQLERGHCEVHPWVHQEYPCSVCLSDNKKQEQQRPTQQECVINDLESELADLRLILKELIPIADDAGFLLDTFQSNTQTDRVAEYKAILERAKQKLL